MSDSLKWLSTADLQAMQAGDVSKISTKGLQLLQRSQVEQEYGSPTDGMSTMDKLRAGIGKGMASGVRALGGGGILERFGLPGTREEAETNDRALSSTTPGKIGSAIGMGALAAPVALIPGANTYAGATALGALTGAALTEGDLSERAQGAAFGAAGGALGKGLGDAAGAGARWAGSKLAAGRASAQAANAQKDAAAVAAREAGYVLPPADVKGGFWNETLNGLSGKIKTAQVASARNQEVTNTLARKAIGQDAGDELTADVLQAIRNDAATRGYAPIRAAGEVVADEAYNKALNTIASQYQGAARSFPGAAKNPVVDMVEGLRQQKFDASDALDMVKVLREGADQAYRQGNNQLGKASKLAADAIEGQLDRHLSAMGDEAAIKAFREARTLIAKTYTVQKALNGQTGDVAAQKLAAELAKGRPLSGELRQVAEVASAFPKATQSLKEAPKAVSPLDFAVAAIGSGGGSNPAGLALMGARPAARSIVLSQPYQARMLTPNYDAGILESMLLPTLQNEAVRRALVPAGIVTSLPGNQ